MNKILRILSCFLLLLGCNSLQAQDFTTFDWNVMKIDSVLPVYTEVVPLESDYRQHDYLVSLEYPEWKALTSQETAALRPFADSITSDIRIESRIGISRRKGVLDISFIPIIVEGGKYKKLMSAKITITPVRKAVKATRINGKAAERFTRTSKLAQGKWVKISIQNDGMYRLTHATLKKMGFTKPENVHLYGYGGHRLSEVMLPDEMYDDMVEVPMYSESGKSAFYFWGNGLVYWNGDQRVFNPYATKAYYFLTEEDAPGSINVAAAVEGAVSQTYTSTPSHVLYEKDDFAWFHGGRNLYDSQNFKNATGRRRSYKLQTYPSQGGERLTVSFSGSLLELTPTVNGTAQSPMTLGSLGSFVYTRLLSKTYDVSKLSTSDNLWNITLQTNNDNDARLDYLALHYNRTLQLTDGYLPFSQTGKGVSQFEILNKASQTKVMRISEPGMPAEMIPVEEMEGLKSKVVVDDPTYRYVAFTTSHDFPEPQYEGTVENQNLHALDSIDMVIIIPTSGKLARQAMRLAEAHRAYDGLRVAVVRADQVYNEFSSGTPDATAYRMLMKMLYDRANESTGYEGPKYLLLMGACLWDNRMLTPSFSALSPDDYLLCFESENSWNDTESYVMEEYFGLLDDGEGATLTRDKTDLGVGRFPVTSEAEAKIMVDKSIDYLTNNNAGSWKNIVMMLGDDGDNNSHMIYCNDVAEQIIEQYPELEVRKVMWDAYNRVSTITNNSYPAVNNLIVKQANEGAAMILYMGHAAPYSMSHEAVMRIADFQKLKGKNLPLWFTAACDVMPFDSPTENLGVTAVLNEGGAALAFIGTARTVYASSNRSLSLQFCKYLFGKDSEGRRYRLGDALRMAKVALIGKEGIHLENKLQYALLGDPALTIGQPLNRVHLSAIKDASTGEGISQIKAGQIVQLEGDVVDNEGVQLNSFNGVVSFRVYDSMDTITCKQNDKTVETAFRFTDRSDVLYVGKDSVRNGRFKLSFVVPRDIKFSNGSGRIVFYGINDSMNVEANGYYEDFTVGGMVQGSDNEGPSIELSLNGEYGGTVNSTPYLVARLFDENGINVSGNGVGHDLTLCIDGDPALTYDLNDYYSADFGDYRSGSLGFTIPELSSGKHTLSLRAWDMLNNTSVQSMDFTVDTSYQPSILNLAASPVIATESTTFLLTYNLPGSNIHLELDVLDYAGRRLWHFVGEGSSNTGSFAIPWNLSVGDNRGRISPGIYLYRASITCGDSKYVTKSKKLIVH